MVKVQGSKFKGSQKFKGSIKAKTFKVQGLKFKGS